MYKFKYMAQLRSAIMAIAVEKEGKHENFMTFFVFYVLQHIIFFEFFKNQSPWTVYGAMDRFQRCSLQRNFFLFSSHQLCA